MAWEYIQQQQGYQNLSDEKKQKFKQIFDTLSSDQKEELYTRLGVPKVAPQTLAPEAEMPLRKALPESPIPAPGTVPPGTYQGAKGQYQGPFTAMNQAGEGLTEDLGRAGVNPYLSAGLGTAFQMAPEVGLGLIPGAKAAKPASRAAVAFRTKAMDIIKTAFKPGAKAQTLARDEALQPLKQLARELEAGSPARQEAEQVVQGIKTVKQNLDSQFKALSESLKTHKGELQGALQKVEETLGLELNPKQIEYVGRVLASPKSRQIKINTLVRLGQKSPSTLQASLSPETLQTEKKVIEALLRKGSLDEVQRVGLYKANSVFGKAIPETAEIRSAIKDTYQALKHAKGFKTSETIRLRRLLSVEADKLKNLKKTDTLKLKNVRTQIKQIQQDTAQLVLEGRKADIYRDRLLKAVLAMSIGGGAASIAAKLTP